ncbi:hypothetical protein PHLGIDRAFT_19920 [Phlebiopsis gigantea 11061_1 CR5-6]|uniref:Uncharacterized protein n=1 Tax=Phlebiopsis gigantea (strain 11061_1 CR5-6) TaxID=745531 RepID=A0A0C3RUG2_PHLG1|nr:hypothetical protein PHLGIDRAFT_19920 [Phlebiopsis gigantea 11061_1 CR5-6]
MIHCLLNAFKVNACSVFLKSTLQSSHQRISNEACMLFQYAPVPFKRPILDCARPLFAGALTSCKREGERRAWISWRRFDAAPIPQSSSSLCAVICKY